MSSSPSEPKWRQPGLGGVRPARVGAGVLLLLAIVIPLLVPTYARRDPELWGFPSSTGTSSHGTSSRPFWWVVRSCSFVATSVSTGPN
jgi:hypothetical protein